MTKQNRNKLIDSENKLMVAKWEVSWRMKKVKGLGSTNCIIKRVRGGGKYSIENIVNNTVITTSGVRQVLDLWGRSHCKAYKSLITMLYT